MVTRGNVLVVDDEINLCRILGAKLAKNGYSVVTVHDGMQAVEKVRELDFDVVLLDLILPKMDGLSALAEIRGMHSCVPVIVMTACESADALEQARHHGVFAYVNKPFDLDSLISLVNCTSRNKCGGDSGRLQETTVLFAQERPVTLEIQNGSGASVYASSICDKSDLTFSVFAPTTDRGTLEVIPRMSVRVGLAAKDAYYTFSSHVLSCEDGPQPILVLDKPGVIYRTQRREHIRILRRIPLQYAPCAEDGTQVSDLRTGETRDISLGGACISVEGEVLPGEILKIELRPKSEKDVISVVAQVLRSKRSEGSNEYILGCRFDDIDADVRRLLEE